MDVFTATADDTNGHVALFIDFVSFVVGPVITVERIHPDGSVHVVRGGFQVSTVATQLYLIDSEAPFGVAVTYRAFEDDPGVSPTANEVTSNSVTLDAGGYNWFKDPFRPWANIRVDLCGEFGTPCTDVGDDVSLLPLGERARAGDFTIVPILDRELHSDIWGRRKGVTSVLSFLSRSVDAIGRIYTLFTAGGPLFIQLLPDFVWPDAYWQPGELTERYLLSDQRIPYRRWSVPITQVDPPSPASAPQGTVCSNWCFIEESFATSADLAAAGQDWGDIASCGV